MADSKTANYSEAQVANLIDLYAEHGNEGLEVIAESLGKSVRSVRSKLVREGVYVSAPKAPKVAKDAGPSKKALLNDLQAIVGFDVTGFTGATKPALQALIDKLSA
jgi:hypothetical protein